VLRPLVCLLAILAMIFAACGDDDDDSGPADTAGDAPATERRDTATCEDVRQPPAKPDGGATKPKRLLARDKVYEVVLATSCGEITFRLDQRTSPRTAASFASLVEAGFFDGTVFHRIVPDFVIQGGDPTGTGTGGPGYSTRDVPPQDTAYVEGVVAMAKSAVEPPGTAGSQFYIVTAADAGLPPEYAVLGEVVDGQDVVDAIGALGDPASGDAGTPLQPVVIETATLETR
jgi:peptidyl-prolyl cis-trans isomerase B (cyclophilin B)